MLTYLKKLRITTKQQTRKSIVLKIENQTNILSSYCISRGIANRFQVVILRLTISERYQLKCKGQYKYRKYDKRTLFITNKYRLSTMSVICK